MKRLALLLLFALSASLAYAADEYQQTVSPSSGASAVSTQLDYHQQYAIQCTTGSARYRTCTSSCSATANDYLVPSAGMDVPMPAGHRYIAFWGEGGAATCRIYKVNPVTIKHQSY